MTSVTLLVENCVHRAGLLAEHGLSWWIESGGQGVLFDTGQGMAVRHNAQRLGIDLGATSAVVVSHGHYDHTGGLAEALSLATRASLWMHPRAVEPKFSGSCGVSRCISTGFMECRQFLEPGREVTVSAEPREVIPGIWMTGEIPRTNDFEDTGGPFFLDEQLTKADPLLDDQAIFFRAGEGVVIVLGCGHSGLVNTVRHVAQLTGGAPLVAVLGGAHLISASGARLDETVKFLRECNPEFLAFNHCTGQGAIRRFEHEFGPRFTPFHTGDRREFPAPA